MTLPQTYELFEYWRNWPPEHESLAALRAAFTGWEPDNARPMTPEEHRASLEARWNSAQAVNVKQLYEMGGLMATDGQPGARMTGANLPGIGAFPGAKHSLDLARQ